MEKDPITFMSNIKYKLYCNDCNKEYIGQAKPRLKEFTDNT